MTLPDVLTEIPEDWKPNWSRLRDDRSFDEVRLVPAEGSKGPHLRLVTHFRYKTSGLSGDEWRTSTMWERSPDGKLYEPFDGPYLNVETGLKAFFPGIFTSHKDWRNEEYVGIDFYWKGVLLYRATYEGKPAPLLVQAGHAPWAEVHASEECGSLPDGWEKKCFQAGCRRDATAVVLLKQQFGTEGVSRPSWLKYPDGLHVSARAFCPTHRRRGDCGLDDADKNYLHVSGTTLDEARGAKHFESPAVLGGVVDLTKGGA